ncbi:MAG: hypothetical protein CL398_06885 [Acidiferrobacteraceae bacterium]|mgnify:CR=1 FL=1|nr:hypothetical protein [Acidiferrobacteraceae bacterium]
MVTGREISYRKFSETHPEDVFELVRVAVPDRIGPREITVQIKKAMVHPCDIGCATGLVNGIKLPAVGGFEAIGVVENVGESLVNHYQLGQRVHVCATHIFGSWKHWVGVWRDYCVFPPEALVAIPDQIDDEVAAQLFVNVMTPYAMVKEMNLGVDDVLLQTAAGSVVGRVMIQLGKIFGFRTLNIVRRRETAEELQDLYKIDSVYVYDGNDDDRNIISDKISQDVGSAPIKYAIDAVSGSVGRFCLDLLSPGGVIYYYGALSGDYSVNVDIVTHLCRHDKLVRGWSIQEHWLRNTPDKVKDEYIRSIWSLLINKKVILPPIGETYALEDFYKAITASQRADKRGKVMLSCLG